MKRKTILSGIGNSGEVTITVESNVKDKSLMRDELESRHEKLVELTMQAMSQNGSYLQRIKVR